MSQVVVRDFYRRYNPASTTDYVFGRFAQTFVNVPRACKTSGSSTTVTENASGEGFAVAIGVGDELYNPATGDRVLVTAKASNASITVSSAVNWAAGTNVEVRKFQSGSTGEDGWVGCAGLTEKVVKIQISTLGSASCTFTIQTRISGLTGSTLYTPAAFTAVTTDSTTGSSSFADIPVPETCEAIRLGVKVATDAADVVSASVIGRVAA